MQAVRAILRLAWASGSRSLDLLAASTDELHEAYEKVCASDYGLCFVVIT